MVKPEGSSVPDLKFASDWIELWANFKSIRHTGK
jgi:hypothetical protein